MTDNPQGKNGITRMWARFRQEAKAIRRVLQTQRRSHDPYTNFWVESCRHGPYLIGHILAVGVPALIGLIIYLA